MIWCMEHTENRAVSIRLAGRGISKVYLLIKVISHI